MAHRANEVVTDALSEGAVRQEEGGSAAMLVCRRMKQRSQPERPERTDPSAVAHTVFDETRQPESRGSDDREGEEGEEEGCRLTLVANGVVPEGAGALVLGALEVALPGGGGVLELLVAVIAVVLPQGHPTVLGVSSSALC